MDRTEKKELRIFGAIWVLIFIIIGILPLLKTGQARNWSLYCATGLFFITLFIPCVLKPVHFVWCILGRMLGWVNTRIILAFVFFFIITPFGLTFKMLRKDILKKKFNTEINSYWEIREEQPTTMKKQY